jgi:hypothetical protein
LLANIALCAPGHYARQAADKEDRDIAVEGKWLGTLQVPGAKLRIAVVVSREQDGTYSATMKSIDQGSGQMPMSEVVYERQRLIVKAADLGVEIEGTVDIEDSTFDAEFRQRPGKFPIVFKRVDELPRIDRPQEPKQPYPYHVEEVTYENNMASITLAGTLTYPESGGPFPAVILLTGSGPQNRDQEILGHKPFLVLSDYLTRQGIAVLRADDRSVGGSGGDFHSSTTADFAEDALRAETLTLPQRLISQRTRWRASNSYYAARRSTQSRLVWPVTARVA